jgi:mRNA interferase RelE/StbE
MSYSVSILRSARKTLGSFPTTVQDRIITAIRHLAINPRPSGVKKLSGRDAWRIRVGDYRIIYEISHADLVVLVVDIGHRKEIYR